MHTIALMYTRVSTGRQEREGMSLPAQTQDCRRYVRDHAGWTLGEEFTDTLTGRRQDRPGYQALLAEARRLRAEGQRVAIVVAALDRLGRNLKEQITVRDELASLGVGTHFVRQGGELSNLTSGVLAVVAEDESARLADRVRVARRQTHESGFPPSGRALWGYTWGASTDRERALGAAQMNLRVDQTAVGYVQEAFERIAAGASVRQVAAWVHGLPEDIRGGRGLDYSKVRGLLHSPIYVARAPSNRGETPAEILARPVGNWPSLVSDDRWFAVQHQIARHSRVPRQARGTYLLTGTIYCPRCGQRMQGHRQYTSRAYACAKPGVGCWYAGSAMAIDRAALDAIGTLLAPLNDAAIRAQLRAEWARISKPVKRPDLPQRQRKLEQAVARARRRVDGYLDRLVDGTITREEYDRNVVRQRTEIDSAERELAETVPVETPPALPSLNDILAAAGGWSAILAGTDIEAQRNILADLVERVVPERVGYGKYEARIAWTPLGKALRKLRRPSPSMGATEVATG
jgi:DNA invertase Pin-like site-specific DNA recombinase